MTEEIFKNIYRIPVPLPNNPLKELNSYLIRGEEGEKDLLIDTGFRMPQCREVLRKGLAELHADSDHLNIFLTHCHADHAGLAPEFVTGDGKIYISDIDIAYLEDHDFYKREWKRTGEILLENGFPARIVDRMNTLNPAMAYAPLQGSVHYTAVKNGDLLRVGGYELRCIFTPGHTPGHMVLWEENTGILFAGDCVLFDITPNITNWSTMKDALGDYLQTLDLLEPLPVRHTLPAHRKTGDFKTRIRELKTHHQIRLDEAYRIVREAPGLNAYEITARMQWNIRAGDWDSFPDSQKFFAVGEAIAHLTHLELQGRIQSVKRDGIVFFSV